MDDGRGLTGEDGMERGAAVKDDGRGAVFWNRELECCECGDKQQSACPHCARFAFPLSASPLDGVDDTIRFLHVTNRDPIAPQIGSCSCCAAIGCLVSPECET